MFRVPGPEVVPLSLVIVRISSGRFRHLLQLHIHLLEIALMISNKFDGVCIAVDDIRTDHLQHLFKASAGMSSDIPPIDRVGNCFFRYKIY